MNSELLPSSRSSAALFPRFQIGFHRMHLAIKVFLEELDTHIGWNAVKTARRHNVNAFFSCQSIIFELHALHEFWFATHINVMGAGIDATCRK